MSNQNNSAAKARKANLMALAQKLDTKNSIKNSAIETVKDVVIGVVGGGLAGAVIGKPSLLVGIVATGIGHYAGWPILSTAGMGMMASGGYQVGQSLISGTEGVDGIEEAKARMKSFMTGLKERLYLDKIIKPKAESSTGDLGNVQYFKYPTNELDMGSLDNIEQELARSASNYQAQMAGPDDQILGPDDPLY